jgi:small subunit ribosomal protein S8
MSMTDPIADMLTRIRNAIISRKGSVEVPASRMKTRIAEILKSEGFIADYRRVERKPASILQIELKWSNDNRCAIEGLKRISRPGRRHYVGKERIPSVRGGQGIAIMTTSKGVMSDRGARNQSVGGEVICEIW